MFEVGQLVQCVDDEARHAMDAKSRDGLTAGKVYTIREIGVQNHWSGRSDCVRLEEIDRSRYTPTFGYEPGFYADRFRPLPSSQISIINSMLVREPTKETA